MFKRELLQNKIYAILLIVCTLPIIFLDGDATATVFMGMIAVPMFFAKENWIYQKEERTYGARASQGRCSLVHPRQEEADCLQYDRRGRVDCTSGERRRNHRGGAAQNQLRRGSKSRVAGLY